jgi:hypothetical protein
VQATVGDPTEVTSELVDRTATCLECHKSPALQTMAAIGWAPITASQRIELLAKRGTRHTNEQYCDLGGGEGAEMSISFLPIQHNSIVVYPPKPSNPYANRPSIQPCIPTTKLQCRLSTFIPTKSPSILSRFLFLTSQSRSGNEFPRSSPT